MTNIEIQKEGLQLPAGFTISHPTLDDVSAVRQLINVCEIAAYGVAETTDHDVRMNWQEPGFTMATDAWNVLAPDGQIIAALGIVNRNHTRIYTRPYIHPDYENDEIGTSLLQLAEKRAREFSAGAPDGVRAVLLASNVSETNTKRQKLLERNGFSAIRNFWRMGIELQEAPPVPQWPEGITIRTLQPGMEYAIYQADEEIFQDHWGHSPTDFAEWSHWACQSENFDPSLWFIAMDGEQIAAIALCADEKEAGGWVHVLGTRRPWRRKGLGLSLLYHTFGEFYRRNIHNVYLGVDAQSLTGATRVYERAGMHVVRQTITYEKELRPGKELSTQTVDI